MDKNDANLILAASCIERASDLIQDGWVRGRFYTTVAGAPVSFCILGALEVAFQELGNLHKDHQREILSICQSFILDEVDEQFRYKTCSIPSFNDSKARSVDDVTSVLRAAAKRVWDVAMESDETLVDLTQYVKPQSEEQKQYLHAVLA